MIARPDRPGSLDGGGPMSDDEQTTSCVLMPGIHSDPLLVAASIVGRGWPVIPLRRGDRRPIGAGGEQHRGIWRTSVCEVLDTAEDLAAEGFPPPSWGVIMGEPDPEGWRLLVLDTDSDEADRRLCRLAEQLGERTTNWLRTTMTVRTARGWHRYGVIRRELATEKPWPGIDFKARGYVVGPGCVHPSGALYQDVTHDVVLTTGRQPAGPAIYCRVDVLDDGPHAAWSVPLPVPDGLIDALHSATSAPTHARSPVISTPVVGGVSSSEQIKQGDRSKTLFNLACSLESQGATDVDALPQLRAAWARCWPPFTDETPEHMWTRVIARYRKSPAGEQIEIAPGVRVDAALEHEFWSGRRAHRVIRQWAHARLCSPYALLVAVLQRVVAAIPSYVVLPPIVGGRASLNLLAALVAPTSGGKDRALDVAAEVVRVPGGMPFREPPLGTGEGLVSAFGHMEGRGGKRRQVRDYDAALIRVSEVDTWAALITRQHTTLEVVIRQAFMGQQLGFSSRTDPTTLDAHSYRLCMSVGVQPEHAGSLLSPEAISGGTAGRFLWVPALTRDLPVEGTVPQTPESLTVLLPESVAPPSVSGVVPTSIIGAGITVGPPVEVRVCLEIEETVRRDVRARLAGQDRTDPLDGYALLVREKLAFALAALDGGLGAPDSIDPPVIGEDDWRLAGHPAGRVHRRARAGPGGDAQHRRAERDGAGGAPGAGQRGRRPAKPGLAALQGQRPASPDDRGAVDRGEARREAVQPAAGGVARRAGGADRRPRAGLGRGGPDVRRGCALILVVLAGLVVLVVSIANRR